MKKQILLAAALLLSAAAQAQINNYTLTVKLPALKQPAKAYLVTQYGWSNNKTIDSALLKNGQFSFNGKIQEPVKVHVVIDHTGKDGAAWVKDRDVLQVYLENAQITITGKDSVAKAVISGSKLNAEYAAYQQTVLAPGNLVSEKVNAAFAAATNAQKNDKNFRDSLFGQIKTAGKKVDSLKYAYISKHPNSFLSLAALTELAGVNKDITRLIPIYQSLSANLRNTESGKQLAQALDDYGPTKIGSLAPDFTQNDVNDKPVKLSNFRGKYVLLDFWASWCGPCRGENPNVLKAYNQYKDKNFTVLGVSLDQPGKKTAWLAAIKTDGLPWTQVSDLQFWNNAAAKLYGIRAIPQNFLIDPNGKIVAKNLRGDALEEKLAQLLK